MSNPNRQNRRPIKRADAERYMFTMLVSFAGSVILTRAFLELTGYPQISTGVLHIAHVLWGGLLLFAAALLPVIFANRWVYTVSALLGGAGVGLFIDEVGKFITANNDYFYPFAAPIIYAVFLITVLLYLRVRHQHEGDDREQLYHVLDGLMEVLDHDLDPHERERVEARLQSVIETTEQPNLRALSRELLEFVRSEGLQVVPARSRFYEPWLRRLSEVERRWFQRRTMRLALATALLVTGGVAFADLTVTLIAFFSPDRLQDFLRDLIISQPLVSGAASLNWAIVRLVLEGLVGALVTLSGVLMLVGSDNRGTDLGRFSLLISLTTINLITLYFAQFTALVSTIYQFILLLALIRYRSRFIRVGETEAETALRRSLE